MVCPVMVLLAESFNTYGSLPLRRLLFFLQKKKISPVAFVQITILIFGDVVIEDLCLDGGYG